MRGLAVALLAFLFVSSLPAAPLEPLGNDRASVADLVDALRAARGQRNAETVRPNIVSVDWTKESFVIPAVGSLAGANGTYFRSDVMIANRRSVPQIISIGFIQRGVNNGTAPVQDFTIGANTTSFNADFLATVLGKSGLGTLLVVAKTSTGAIDTLGEIDGFSRIWTPQPGSSGTVSQAFESIDIQDDLSTSYGYGLRQDVSFRTNVGLVNLFSTSNTFTVVVVGTRGSTTFTQVVQPYSMEQVALPAGTYGDLYLRISSDTFNFNWWTAYGTSVDNVTGDGWVSHVH